MWRALSRVARLGRPGGDLSVVFLHRVLPEPDPLFGDELDRAAFVRVLGWLSSQYKLLPLDEAVSRLRAGTLPRGSAAISFDDGYEDNVSVAAPVLRSMGIPATFFIATSFLDGAMMWNDRLTEGVRRAPEGLLSLRHLSLGSYPLSTATGRAEVAGQLVQRLKYLPPAERDRAVDDVVQACGNPVLPRMMMSRDQVRELAAHGFGVGAHTVTHPILTATPAADAQREIETSGRDLSRLLGRPVRLFAYPNGRLGKDYSRVHRDLVEKAGYEAAFTTDPGAARPGDDLYALPRFTPWDRTEWRFRWRMLANQRRQPVPAHSASDCP